MTDSWCDMEMSWVSLLLWPPHKSITSCPRIPWPTPHTNPTRDGVESNTFSLDG